MESLSDVAVVLHQRGLQNLSRPLQEAGVEFREEEGGHTYDGYHVVATAIVSAPFSDYDYLVSLQPQDRQRVLKTIQEVWPVLEDGTELTLREIEFRLDRNSLQVATDSADDLIQQLEKIRSMLIAVSTGGPAINDVDSEYKELYFTFSDSLRERGLQNPIPYTDLWDWYGKWSSGDLPRWQSRREHIRSLCKPIEKILREGLASQNREVFREPTGWGRADRSLIEIRNRLVSASTEEQFQAVGHLCRDTLISVAQTVYDQEQHAPSDGVQPSKTDAKRMLESFLAATLKGESNYNTRRLAKSTIDFANEVLHKRTATFRDAALSAQATSSVVNIISIIAGVRDPK